MSPTDAAKHRYADAIPPTMPTSGPMAWTPWSAEEFSGKLRASHPHYRILNLISHGGMGAVYEATDTQKGHAVAIKVMRPDLLAEGDFVERFQREIQMLRELKHPHIVSLVDRDLTADRVPFLVMPLLEGRSLAEVIQDKERLTLPRILSLMQQLCAGTAALHDKGIIHRDLKPANIFLRAPDDHAIILDLGIARPQMPLDGLHTQTGQTLGTESYMAPEVKEGKKAEKPADIYALGIILYQLLTQRFPEGNCPPPSAFGHDLRFDAILAQARHQDPRDRYQTATEFVEALKSLQSPAASTVSATPTIGDEYPTPDPASILIEMTDNSLVVNGFDFSMLTVVEDWVSVLGPYSFCESVTESVSSYYWNKLGLVVTTIYRSTMKVDVLKKTVTQLQEDVFKTSAAPGRLTAFSGSLFVYGIDSSSDSFLKLLAEKSIIFDSLSVISTPWEKSEVLIAPSKSYDHARQTRTAGLVSGEVFRRRGYHGSSLASANQNIWGVEFWGPGLKTKPDRFELETDNFEPLIITIYKLHARFAGHELHHKYFCPISPTELNDRERVLAIIPGWKKKPSRLLIYLKLLFSGDDKTDPTFIFPDEVVLTNHRLLAVSDGKTESWNLDSLRSMPIIRNTQVGSALTCALSSIPILAVTSVGVYYEQIAKGRDMPFDPIFLISFAFILLSFLKIYRGFGSFWTLDIGPNAPKGIVLPSEEDSRIDVSMKDTQLIWDSANELDFKAKKLAFEWAQLFHFTEMAKRLIADPLIRFPEPKSRGNTNHVSTQQQFRFSPIHPCRTCGKEVAKTARTCPHCGENLRSGKKPSGWRQKACSNCGEVMSRFAQKCQQPDCGHPNTWLKVQSTLATLAVLGGGFWCWLHYTQQQTQGLLLPIAVTVLALGWRGSLSLLKSFYSH